MVKKEKIPEKNKAKSNSRKAKETVEKIKKKPEKSKVKEIKKQFSEDEKPESELEEEIELLEEGDEKLIKEKEKKRKREMEFHDFMHISNQRVSNASATMKDINVSENATLERNIANVPIRRNIQDKENEEVKAGYGLKKSDYNHSSGNNQGNKSNADYSQNIPYDDFIRPERITNETTGRGGTNLREATFIQHAGETRNTGKNLENDYAVMKPERINIEEERERHPFEQKEEKKYKDVKF